MRRALLVAALLVAAPPARAAAPAKDGLSEEERAACATELETLHKRRKVFEGQGLSAADLAKRNAPQINALEECREKFRAESRRQREERQDLEEVARRAGPNATEKERAAAWREIRRERLASKSPASLTAAEKAELAEGMGEELSATHHALDEAHSRDPRFMRVIHSAMACYHGERAEQLREQIKTEESLLKVGTGERSKLYPLKVELRESDEVLARTAEAAKTLPGGLDRCASPTVAVVSHCLGVKHSGKKSEPACESEEIQQYVRFVK